MDVNSANISAALKTQIGTDKAELVRLVYNSLDVRKDVTYYPDIKNEQRITTMTMNDIVKPFSTDFSATAGALDFKPRTVGVKVAKAELSFSPTEFRQTYMAKFQTPGVGTSPEDLPFAKDILDTIFKKFGQELNDRTAYKGIWNANGTTAIDVATGYGKHIANMITAGDVVPNAVGTLNSTTGQDQMTALYRSIPAQFRQKGLELKAYMSEDSYNAINDSLDKKGYNTGRGEEQLGPKYLRNSNQILELKPVSWMAGSNRVIITPLSNILLLGDAIDQDLALANIIQKMWGFDLGIACAIGFDFAYAGLIWCNEVA